MYFLQQQQVGEVVVVVLVVDHNRSHRGLRG